MYNADGTRYYSVCLLFWQVLPSDYAIIYDKPKVVVEEKVDQEIEIPSPRKR